MKKNLRKFEGFEFDGDSDEYKKKLEATQKMDLAKLKAVCDGLLLEKKGLLLSYCYWGFLFQNHLSILGSKEEISERICEFLLAPQGGEEEDVNDEEEAEDEEQEEEEEKASSEEDKKKKKPRRNAREEKASRSSGGRPRRSTAGRNRDMSSYVEYSSSEEEKFPSKQPRKRYKEESDSGSDVRFFNFLGVNGL